MNWFLAYEENYKCRNKDIKSIADIKREGFDVISASVLGNVELDF